MQDIFVIAGMADDRLSIASASFASPASGCVPDGQIMPGATILLKTACMREELFGGAIVTSFAEAVKTRTGSAWIALQIERSVKAQGLLQSS